MKKGLFFSMITIASRTFFGFLLLFFLARIFSVDKFGVYTYSLVVSTLLVLIIEYGYTIKFARDAAKDISTIPFLTSLIIRTKFFLTGITIVGYLVLASTGFLSFDEIRIVGIILAGSIMNSYANNLLIPYKSIDKFQVESIYVFLNNLIVFVLSITAAYITKSLVFVALGFLVAKLVFLLMVLIRYSKDFGFEKRKFNIWNELKASFPFAIHLAVGAVYLNADTVILKQYVSNYDIGIYQAGLRALGVATILFGVFNNVLIPKLSAIHNRFDHFVKEVRKYNYLAISLGLIIAIFINLFSKSLIKIVFTEKFIDLDQYVIYFTVIIFLRYLGLVYGIVLSISDRQMIRSLGVLSTLIFIIASDLLIVPIYGIIGALYVLIIAHILLNIIYITFTYIETKKIML